jgi:multicomponent Na+:H+ antiporter subunit G
MTAQVLRIAAYVFMIGGVFFAFSTRIHAGTKALTGGALLVLTGAALIAPTWQAAAKILLIAGFFLLTNPLSSHAIARACYRHGIRPEASFKDEYGEALEKGEKR